MNKLKHARAHHHNDSALTCSQTCLLHLCIVREKATNKNNTILIVLLVLCDNEYSKIDDIEILCVKLTILNGYNLKPSLYVAA